jgi:hypothetical protein
MDEKTLDAFLGRLKDATQFIVKADGFAFVGLITLAGTLKLDAGQIVKAAFSLSTLISSLTIALAFAFGLWGIVATLMPTSEPAKNKAIANRLNFLYLALLLVHAALIGYTLGFTNTYIKCFHSGACG